ncbi:Protein cbp3, mitochondrial [Ceratobasidium sp. 395]|nr:Protein cbp3, mitochondrial [Ceratobasidium sp. 395]
MALYTRLSVSPALTRLAAYPTVAPRIAPRFASRYSYSTQLPPSSPPPAAPSNPKGPKELSTPPEPPIEYSRKPREISTLSKNPWVVRAVKMIAPFMGYYSKTTTAIRETRAMYALCGERLEKEQDFLYKECALPPTYQTWFQFTLIHVLILTARLRALPPSVSKAYQAELINHFFLDIEHRMRAVLGPKVPERIVRGYMKEMRDQWRGGGAAFDLGIAGPDATLAGMIWRNLFASRGALPSTPQPDDSGKRKLVIAGAEDAALPPILYQFVGYARREIARLEAIPDKEVAYGRIGDWGTVSSIRVPTGEADFAAWQATGSAIKGGQKQAATA